MHIPIVGRFLTEDPLGEESGDSNFYRYCLNNPVNLVDPSGLSALGKIIRQAFQAASKKAITEAVQKEIRDNWYKYLRQYLKKEGLGKLYEGHHLIVQVLFKEKRFADFFETVGILKDSSKNITLLPTPKALKAGEDVGKAALHRGKSIAEYSDYVKASVESIVDNFTSKSISKEEARQLIYSLQSELRSKLQSGELRLHNYDTADNREALRNGVNLLILLGIWSGLSETEAQAAAFEAVAREVENESYYRQKNIIVRYGEAGYYTRNSNSSVARWTAFAVDFFNPVEDVVFVTDLIEDTVRGLVDFTKALEDVVSGATGDIARSLETIRTDPNAAWRLRRKMFDE